MLEDNSALASDAAQNILDKTNKEQAKARDDQAYNPKQAIKDSIAYSNELTQGLDKVIANQDQKPAE